MKRAAIFVFLVACGSAGAPAPPPTSPPVAPPPPATRAPDLPPVTPDAEFRKSAPLPDGKVTFVPPKIESGKLKNGVRVLCVERHELPVVALRVVVPIGAGDVPGARPGSLAFLGAMLEQGTKKRTALQLSDDFEAIGASHGAWIGWDSGEVNIKVLGDKLDLALDLLRDVTLAPTLPDEEIERLRTRWIAGIQSEKSSPGSVIQNNIAAAIYSRAHPYGHSLNGEEADAKKVTRAELASAYARLFAPKHAAIVVAGDVTLREMLPKLETAFGGWKSGPSAADRHAPKAPIKPAVTKRIVLVDRPGAQSQIRVARVGVARSTKDREAIVVMNAILGGMFSSRINMNLREKNAYTYGARSWLSMLHGAGPFQMGAAVFADKTGPAIKEVLAELDALKADGPTADELALAKESILLAMPSGFETVSDVTSAAAELVVYDLPLNDYEKRPARIEAVSAADVKRVASELLGRDAMTIVVVGTKSVIAPQLATLGLGDFEERDPYGNPVDAAKP